MSYRSHRRTSACPLVSGLSEAIVLIRSTPHAEVESLRPTRRAQDRIADRQISAVRMSGP